MVDPGFGPIVGQLAPNCPNDPEQGGLIMPIWKHIIASILYSSIASYVLARAIRNFRKQLSAMQMIVPPSARSWPAKCADGVLFLGLLASISLLIYHKYQGHKMAFLFQPCHVLHIFLLFLFFFPRGSGTGAILFSFYLHVIVAPAIGFAAADLSCYKQWMELENWAFQHFMLMFVPMIWIGTGRFPLYTGRSFFALALSILVLYHSGVLVPVSLLTAVNINYMICPPAQIPPLMYLGIYYREAITAGILVLAWVVRYIVVEAFIRLVGANTKDAVPYVDIQLNENQIITNSVLQAELIRQASEPKVGVDVELLHDERSITSSDRLPRTLHQLLNDDDDSSDEDRNEAEKLRHRKRRSPNRPEQVQPSPTPTPTPTPIPPPPAALAPINELAEVKQEIIEVKAKVLEVEKLLTAAIEKRNSYEMDEKKWDRYNEDVKGLRKEKEQLGKREEQLRDKRLLLLRQQDQRESSEESEIKTRQMIEQYMKEFKPQSHTRRSLRRTTEEWANDIINAPCQLDRFDEYLVEVSEADLEEAWEQCRGLRERMQKVTKEVASSKDDDVQTIMFKLAEICTAGGPLVCRDTHLRDFPSDHKIDLSFVSSKSPCANNSTRVTWAEIASFGELKFSVTPPAEYRSVAIQCSDRLVELIEASAQRKSVLFFIADQTRIRFFVYDYSSDTYISTTLDTLLSTASDPTNGFRLFYRFCRTSATKLGLPSPPVAPTVDGFTLFLVREGGPGKANVYRADSSTDNRVLVCKSFGEGSRFMTEINVLKELNELGAPVPQIYKIDKSNRFILVGPFGKTLRNMPFSVDLLAKASAVCIEALQIASSLPRPLGHYDPSPDNIIVCKDGFVHLNDWGSARPFGKITNTGGTNPVYCCPRMSAAFACGNNQFMYTQLSDLRALFISLLSFSLCRRHHSTERLPAVLPWEREDNMPAAKWLHLGEFMNWDNVEPKAVPLLRRVHTELFLRTDVDIDLVCKLFKDLKSTIPEEEEQKEE